MGRVRKPKSNKGAYLLRAWLASEAISYEELASRVECTKGYICQLVNSESTPGLKLSLRLETETGGFIAPRCWVEAEPS